MVFINYIKSRYPDDLPHRAVAVYRYLKDRCNAEGTCFPGIKTISEDLSLSRSTVKRAINDLIHAGHIEKEQRWRRDGGKSSLLFKLKE